MQTFLPYPDFLESFRTLDRMRLGNQVYKEGAPLFNGKWIYHPASKMWRGYRYALGLYCLAGATVMGERGWHQPSTVLKWIDYFTAELQKLENTGLPPWLGDDAFHASHRSALLTKHPEWYNQFGWTEPFELPYVWPV